MTQPTKQALSLIAALLFSLSASADEVRTKDGRTLVGPTKVLEKVVIIDTVDGKVRVALSDVLRIRSDAQLRVELKKLASASSSNTLHGQLELGRRARAFGLTDEMWTYLEHCVAISQGSQRQPRFMTAFLASLEPEILNRRARKTRTEVKVKELLYRVRPTQSPARIAAIEAILTKLEGADKALFTAARRMSKKQQRLCALRAIENRGTDADLYFLFRSGIYESDRSVRQEAMDMTRRANLTEVAVGYLAQGLTHRHPQVRIRTAEAYGMLKSKSAVELLVHAGPIVKAASAADGAVRAHIAIINQQAYIQDFDVEVAQAAFIADPKVNVLQSGMVLDAGVVSVATHRTIIDSYRQTLRQLAGSDPGPRTSRWTDWYAGLVEDGIVAASTAVVTAKPGPATPGPIKPVRSIRKIRPSDNPGGPMGTATTLTGEEVLVRPKPTPIRIKGVPNPARSTPTGSRPTASTPVRSTPVRSVPVRRR